MNNNEEAIIEKIKKKIEPLDKKVNELNEKIKESRRRGVKKNIVYGLEKEASKLEFAQGELYYKIAMIGKDKDFADMASLKYKKSIKENPSNNKAYLRIWALGYEFDPKSSEAEYWKKLKELSILNREGRNYLIKRYLLKKKIGEISMYKHMKKLREKGIQVGPNKTILLIPRK